MQQNADAKTDVHEESLSSALKDPVVNLFEPNQELTFPSSVEHEQQIGKDSDALAKIVKLIQKNEHGNAIKVEQEQPIAKDVDLSADVGKLSKESEHLSIVHEQPISKDVDPSAEIKALGNGNEHLNNVHEQPISNDVDLRAEVKTLDNGGEHLNASNEETQTDATGFDVDFADQLKGLISMVEVSKAKISDLEEQLKQNKHQLDFYTDLAKTLELERDEAIKQLKESVAERKNCFDQLASKDKQIQQLYSELLKKDQSLNASVPSSSKKPIVKSGSTSFTVKVKNQPHKQDNSGDNETLKYYESAIKAEQSKEKDPFKLADLYFEKAQFLFGLNQYPESFAASKTALSYLPESYDLLKFHLHVASIIGNKSLIRETLQAILRAYPNDTEALKVLNHL